MNIKDEIVAIIHSVSNSTKAEIQDYDRPLKEMGVDSLDLSTILLDLEEKYSIKIPDEDISRLTTVNLIAAYINRKIRHQ
mgnify:CR=1 FL=1